MVGVLFISFLVCLAVGVPVAFSLGIASCLYFLGSGMPIVQFAQRFFAGMDSFTLLCIPGFTLAGNLMNQGGISDKLLGFADALVGHLRGGLAYANILASMVFAGISGTALADTVALGGIEIPMMVQQGYDTPFSVAVTASSSCMGPIIPPSVPMIIAATMTGLSVSKMFMAGIFPGILMGVSMCLVCYLEAKKKKYPKRDKMLSFKEILKAGREALSRQTSAATTRVTVKQAGTFSNQVDGYESLLTPEQARSLTPAALERLMDEPPASDREALGKLILGSRWYFVTNLPVETAQRLSSETPARLRFTGEFDQEVDMAVEHISQAEGERVTVVFSTDRYLGQTTLLRRQTAELVFEDFTGLRVPKEAVRMVKVESTDEQTGEVTVTSRLGVYALVSGRAEFKRVEVVTEGGDYYVVKPADSGRKILRAGDEVITRATGLYDGQLLEF